MKKVVVKKGNVYRVKNKLELKDWVVITIMVAIIDFILYCILF